MTTRRQHDDPLEAGSSLGKVPIIGEILEAIVQSFLGMKLFFLDPEAWIEFIKKDRWAVRSSTLLLAMLTLTYFITKILGQKTFSYSGHTYEIANAIFLLIFAICIGFMLKILGSSVSLTTSASAILYVLAIGLPFFWLYLIASYLIAAENPTSSIILMVFRFIFLGIYVLIWLRSLPMIRDLCQISNERLVGAIILAGIFVLFLIILVGNFALEGAQYIDDLFKHMED
jgi:hypothetical protein